ncbi:MAG: glycoside hydrolase family 6 protein [Polyangiales bacterium]
MLTLTFPVVAACAAAPALDEPDLTYQVAAPARSSDNPFAGQKLYVDPDASAAVQARAWRTTRPDDAAQLDKLARSSQADWLGGWSTEATVRARVATIRAAGALPVFVLYNIPGRDCGQFSAGGADTGAAYASWIDSVARGLDGHPAAVVLEPDAIALTDCLSQAGRDARFAMLARAIDTLSSRGVAVYLDAGHSSWHAPAEMAARLIAAGVAKARGFSVNVSNYRKTEDELAYGREIAARVGKAFVVDTSRNGLGPRGGEWCNPEGRALGARPTAETADPRADAYLWIKRPGESDGTCNGGPTAGAFWAQYALGLAKRAAY